MNDRLKIAIALTADFQEQGLDADCNEYEPIPGITIRAKNQEHPYHIVNLGKDHIHHQITTDDGTEYGREPNDALRHRHFTIGYDDPQAFQEMLDKISTLNARATNGHESLPQNSLC